MLDFTLDLPSKPQSTKDVLVCARDWIVTIDEDFIRLIHGAKDAVFIGRCSCVAVNNAIVTATARPATAG